MRSAARCFGCSSATAVCSTGSPRPSPRAACAPTGSASIVQMAGSLADRVAGGAVRLVLPAARRCRSPRPSSSPGCFAPAIARWVSLPPADAGSLAISEADARVAAADRAADLALLRDLRHRGRQHAAAGQLPGGSHAGRRPPDVADQSSASTAVDRRARDFGWIGTLEAVERLEATLGDDGAPEALPRPLLQLVRHVAICGRSIRPISRRSTAAISPAT